MSASSQPKAFPLRLTRREIIEPVGDSDIECTVLCPRRGSISLKTCLGCEHGEGFSTSKNGLRSCFYCTLPDLAAGSEELRVVKPASTIPTPAIADNTTIARAMTTNIVCARETLGVHALSNLFVNRGVSAAPVVDSLGQILGVVSKSDLTRELAEPTGCETARDLMTPMTFTLQEDCSIARAAALMAFESVHQVVVTSHDHRIAGILTSLDVMRWLARHDGYIT